MGKKKAEGKKGRMCKHVSKEYWSSYFNFRQMTSEQRKLPGLKGDTTYSSENQLIKNIK
jgi:hypothetical protein